MLLTLPFIYSRDCYLLKQKSQLQVKSYSSNSWFIDIKTICIKYGILEPYKYFENPLSKIEWKKLIKKHIHSYWRKKYKRTVLHSPL